MISLFKLLGIVGMILIIAGVLIKRRNRKIRDLCYIAGGLFLLSYSYHIKDYIFITLQIVFILVAIYDLAKLKKFF